MGCGCALVKSNHEGGHPSHPLHERRRQHSWSRLFWFFIFLLFITRRHQDNRPILVSDTTDSYRDCWRENR